MLLTPCGFRSSSVRRGLLSELLVSPCFPHDGPGNDEEAMIRVIILLQRADGGRGAERTSPGDTSCRQQTKTQSPPNGAFLCVPSPPWGAGYKVSSFRERQPASDTLLRGALAFTLQQALLKRLN
ncbi:unnamed protein product [Gadus morhua 'NCC']